MATVIDSLIVELNLDPKKFNDEQQKAVAGLRRFETQAGRAAQGVERNAGASAISFLRSMESPFASLRQKFETLATTTVRPQRNLADLGAQGRRTGASIEAGALAGASGLRVLGIAGAVAMTSIVLLDKSMRAAEERANKVFGAGTRAAGAGIPIQHFTAISESLYRNQAVPREQTEAWLSEMGKEQERSKVTGWDPGRLRAFAQAGIGQLDLINMTPEQLMMKSAAYLATLNEQTAIARGGMIGYTDVQSRGLRSAGPNLPGQVEATDRAGYTTTKRHEDAAYSFILAMNKMWSSIAALYREVDTEMNPGLERAATAVAGFSDAIRENISLIQKVGTFLLNLTPWGWAAKYMLNVGGAAPGVKDDRSFWQKWLPPWFGGKPAPTGGGAGAIQGTTENIQGAGQGHVASRAERIAYAREYAVSKNINPDAVVATMAGEGLNRYVGDNGTSFGDLQLHVGGGMGDAAVASGINIRDPNTWKEQLRFGIDQMDRNRNRGAEWYAGQWHGAPSWAAQQFNKPSLSAPVTTVAGKPQDNRGLLAPDDPAYKAWAREQLARGPTAGIVPYIRGANAAAAGGSSVINHGDANIGDVHVNAPYATNAQDIALSVGGKLRDELRNVMNASQATSSQS